MDLEESHSDSDDDIVLPPSTVAALTSFLEEQSEAQQIVDDLSARYYESIWSTDPDRGALQSPYSGHAVNEEGDTRSIPQSENFDDTKRNNGIVPLTEFKRLFKENWQLSQFWYTEDTAERLTDAILRLSKPDARVAFVCCPTGYAAYKRKAPFQDLRLLEYDTRFAMLAGRDFVKYDLDEPLHFPPTVQRELHHSQDIVVIDPPFHAEASQRNLAITVKHILHPENGYVILLTGTSLNPLVDEIYKDLPNLTRRKFVIEHDGTGRLETPCTCWVGGGNGDGDESGFDGIFNSESEST